jgi:hypothetical protein
MIDCSDTEIAGIRSSYGPNATILLCYWHMLKAVTERAKDKLAVKGGKLNQREKADANRTLRTTAVADFRRLVYSNSVTEFELCWQELLVTYEAYPSWITYLTAEWIVKKEKKWPHTVGAPRSEDKSPARWRGRLLCTPLRFHRSRSGIAQPLGNQPICRRWPSFRFPLLRVVQR